MQARGDTAPAGMGAEPTGVWESAEAMQAYEQSDFYRQEILPTLHPFFVGEFTTTYCSRSTLGPDNRMGSPGHYRVPPQ